MTRGALPRPVSVVVSAWRRGVELPFVERVEPTADDAELLADELELDPRTSVIELASSSGLVRWRERVPGPVVRVVKKRWRWTISSQVRDHDLFWCSGDGNWPAHGWYVGRPGDSCPWCIAMHFKRALAVERAERAAQRRAIRGAR